MGLTGAPQTTPPCTRRWWWPCACSASRGLVRPRDGAEYGLSYAVSGTTGIQDRTHLRDFSSASFTAIATNTTNLGGSDDFIWNGTFNNLGASGTTPDVVSISQLGASEYDSGLFLSKFHPLIQDASGDEVNSGMTLDEIISTGAVAMPKYAVKRSNDQLGGKLQTAYQPLTITFRDGSESGPKDDDGTVIARKSIKNSFTEEDKYLLGGLSCGSFLYLSPINQESLSVDGPTKYGKKIVEGGSQNAISVDMVFQYRMTDYFGNDASSDIGRIGGQAKLSFPNLTYTKKIGLDIFDKYDTQFSFDLEVFAKYSPKGKNLNSIRAAQLVRNVPTSTNLASKPRLFQFESR